MPISSICADIHVEKLEYWASLFTEMDCRISFGGNAEDWFRKCYVREMCLVSK
jgi:hypothetical protein